jgi:hypothetical protein
MSLQTRLSTLISAIGADIKALQNRTYDQYNASTAVQTVAGNSDTYIAGSRTTFPTGKIKAGTVYRCRFNVVKTAAATAAPVITVRVGTAGTTADTSRAALTFAAQTAVIDEGWFEVECKFNAAGAAAVIQALGNLYHRLVTTGLNVTGTFTQVLNTGASFDVTGASLGIGISVNAGASSSWAITMVSAELVNLTP